MSLLSCNRLLEMAHRVITESFWATFMSFKANLLLLFVPDDLKGRKQRS